MKRSGLLAVLKQPMTRSECADVPRPCPFVHCRYNLVVEIHLTGVPMWHVKESCFLDVLEAAPPIVNVQLLKEDRDAKTRRFGG